MTLEPRQQCWTEVKTDERVVDDVWRVTLGVNALVPIVKRRGARLRIDFAGPWILAWWLIKMAVDYEATGIVLDRITGFTRLTGILFIMKIL